MIVATLYFSSSKGFPLELEKILDELAQEIPHKVVRVDIDSDDSLLKTYGDHVPVVEVGPYLLREPHISRQDLFVALSSARDRKVDLEAVEDPDYQKRVLRGKRFSSTDRFSYWFTRRYMLVFNLLVLIYVGLPFLAPVLLESGLNTPARIIYTIYKPMCHQLTFRSWFLFGEQTFYPRELAHIPGVETYEELMGTNEISILDARSFTGNEQAGYKVALCERDIAIYGGILLFGILFSLTGKKLKQLPWYIWVIVGIIPIGLDGGSQLPGLVNGILPGWIPLRESTPLLRTLTGSLFGITTAWYLYPMIEDAMGETRRVLMRKKAVVDQTQS